MPTEVMEEEKVLDQDVFSIASLAELTGIPTELLQKELLLDGLVNERGEMSMGELRTAMCRYLDSTMLTKELSEV